jgi:UDP-glucose/galactose:(glucosyl)LPS alpha-1,2-glucosyl/galactosyltransferase
MSGVIDVFFASDRAYYSGLFVALESCAANCSSKVRFTVVLNESDPRVERCLEHVKSKPNVVDIRVLQLDDLKEIDNYRGRSHFSKMAFARLLMGDVYADESLKQVLYMDPDIVIHTDVSDLWAMGGRHPLMMSDQNNSGVMLMNLEYWRSNDMDQKCIALWKEKGESFKHPDQDLLIELFNNRGLCGFFEHERWNLGSGYWDGKSSCVIHCIGGRKPWHNDYQYHIVSELFDRYYVNVFGSIKGLRKSSLVSSLSRRLNNFKIKFGLK